MNARELIHALSAEWIDQDQPIQIGAFDSTGEYYTATVTKVTATARGVTIDYEASE